jgi:hypothetical protein
MYRNNKSSYLFAVFITLTSISGYAQNNMSGIGALNSMTGAMQGFARGMADADDRNRQIYEMNMRVYQANLDSYYQCIDLQLRARQQGLDIDMSCKKPNPPQ